MERTSCGTFHNFLLDLIVLLRLPLTVLNPEWSKFYSVWLFWIENQDMQYVAIIMTIFEAEHDRTNNFILHPVKT